MAASIWVINALLQWGVLALVLWKRGWRHHLAFTVYIAFCSCKTSLLIWVGIFAGQQFFVISWMSRIIEFPLMIAVLVEVFAAVFRPYSTLPEGSLRWFKIGFCSLVLLTIALAIFFPGASPGRQENTFLVLSRSAAIIFCGSFGFTALVSSYFGIPWEPRTFGIGVGFLLFMSVDLLAFTLSTTYGWGVGQVLDNVLMLGYSLALVTWVTYFARRDLPLPPPTLEQLQRLQKALDYSSRKAESFQKHFER